MIEDGDAKICMRVVQVRSGVLSDPLIDSYIYSPPLYTFADAARGEAEDPVMGIGDIDSTGLHVLGQVRRSSLVRSRCC